MSICPGPCSASSIYGSWYRPKSRKVQSWIYAALKWFVVIFLSSSSRTVFVKSLTNTSADGAQSWRVRNWLFLRCKTKSFVDRACFRLTAIADSTRRRGIVWIILEYFIRFYRFTLMRLNLLSFQIILHFYTPYLISDLKDFSHFRKLETDGKHVLVILQSF